MNTSIFVSNSIKKSYKKIKLHSLSENEQSNDKLNSWNAHIMLWDKKKCWIVTHSLTRYTVIIPDVKSKDLESLRLFFLDSLVNQLLKSGLEINPNQIENFIGEIDFYSTNGDRSCISYINQRIQELDYWKYDYENFNEVPFYALGAKINDLGGMKREGKSEFIRPDQEMIELFNIN